MQRNYYPFICISKCFCWCVVVFVGVSGGLYADLMQLHQDYRLEKWLPPQHNGDSVGKCCFREGASFPWSILCHYTPLTWILRRTATWPFLEPVDNSVIWPLLCTDVIISQAFFKWTTVVSQYHAPRLLLLHFNSNNSSGKKSLKNQGEVFKMYDLFSGCNMHF